MNFTKAETEEMLKSVKASTCHSWEDPVIELLVEEVFQATLLCLRDAQQNKGFGSHGNGS